MRSDLESIIYIRKTYARENFCCNIEFYMEEIEVINFKLSKHQFRDRMTGFILVSQVFPQLSEAVRGTKTDMKKERKY